MRSPVYNSGARGAGNLNLKGKKTTHLTCGCCTAFDFREDYRKQQIMKAIRERDFDRL